MVKIKAICRDNNDYKRTTNTEIEKVFRNNNPNLHQFSKPREYMRALNAVKLEKVFAKPFICSLNNHTDGIKCMGKNNKNLSEIISGGFDGQIILWDLPKRQPIFNINSGHNFVKGVCFSDTGDEFISAGDDQTINIWNKHNLYNQKENQKKNITFNNFNLDLENPMYYNYKPSSIYNIDGFIDSVDHSYHEKCFATAGSIVAVWNYEKNSPISTFKSSVDGFIRVKFNPVENHILLATGYDRSINIFDLRTNNPLKNVSLKNKSAAACWNPQEPFNFTIGNEDSNCYTFDMRKLDRIKMIHKDHILAMYNIL
jgi:WD repeat and SOF domain-containing protein 1